MSNERGRRGQALHLTFLCCCFSLRTTWIGGGMVKWRGLYVLNLQVLCIM